MTCRPKLACIFLGHRWTHLYGIYIDGKGFPSLDVKRCKRCGDQRTDLFNGGL